ncbi:MAG TPA: DNA internalization-related competence protein ComEC/Rec2 [Tepidisphaeraceae bacterium]|nr:DNA internalization-related competence protein ComEC/Rec2 [Tepidisphaeraceae bacterium]
MIGIALHDVVPHWPVLWIVLLAGLLGAVLLTFRRTHFSCALVAIATLITGIALAQAAAFHYPRDHVSAFAGDEPRLAMVEMKLIEPPRIITTPPGVRRPLPPKQVTTARVTRIKTWNGWIDASGDMLVQILVPHPRLTVGQTIRALGMLQRPAPAMNPGQFDWATYYREQRILVSMQIPEIGNITLLGPPDPSVLDRLREKTRRLLAMGFSENRLLDHALLRALLLGDRDPELRDVTEQFKRTGTSHHLAISGMHVAVLGGFVLLVCRLLRLSPRLSVWTMTMFVVLYGAVALPSPPVIRSVLLCIAFGFGLVMRRSVDALQLLAVSVLAMLIYYPLDLFNAGFQLSFGTVLALVVLTGTFLQFLRDELKDEDAEALARLQRPSWAAAWWRWQERAALRVLAASIVAWVASMPLIALHFEQLNTWAVLAGILIAPVVFLSLLGGLFKVVLTLLWPALAEWWAVMAATPVGWMRGMVEWLTVLPGSAIPLPAPPIWIVFAFYALLLLATMPCSLPTLTWGKRCAPITACAALLLAPFHTEIAQLQPSRDELRVTLLHVGAGQCAVVEPPSGRTVLLDAGSTSLFDLVPKCLGPYLRHRGRTNVDTVLISHANYDHFSAVAEVAAAYDVREVIVGGQFRKHARDNPPAEAMLSALDAIDRPPRAVSPGDDLPLGRETSIRILWPPASATVDANNASVVFRLSHGHRSILFTGDIQDDGMRELLKNPDVLKADILIAPHHGSSESLTDAFIAAVNPSAVLSSNDRTLSQKQVRLESFIGDSTLYRTHRCGALTITLHLDGGMRIEPYLKPGSESGRR